jgi:hypothetical protein
MKEKEREVDEIRRSSLAPYRRWWTLSDYIIYNK